MAARVVDDPRDVSPLITGARVVAWSAIILLVGYVVGLSPMSPLALRRADALLAAGRAEQAGELFELISVINPLPVVRRRALQRAALVWTVDARDPHRAQACLQNLIGADPPPEVTAEAWAQLGGLLIGPLHDVEQAAAAFNTAYEAAPEDAGAADRLAWSARAMTESGRTDDAYAVWEKLGRRFPEREAEAKLAQAQILLAKGRLGQALTHFKQVADASPDELVATVAVEGVVAVEERMERLKATLTQLESREIPLELRRRMERAERNPTAHELGSTEDEPAP